MAAPWACGAEKKTHAAINHARAPFCYRSGSALHSRAALHLRLVVCRRMAAAKASRAASALFNPPQPEAREHPTRLLHLLINK